MELVEKGSDGVVVVAMIGKMDAVTAPEFTRWFEGRIESGGRSFVVDCAGLTYVSSAGLRGFLTVAKQVKALQGRLVISGLCGVAREVFQISGFLSLFETYPTVEEAAPRT